MLVNQPNRFAGNRLPPERNYEDGMVHAFERCHEALNPDGRLVVVFANSYSNAWEALASAFIRAGFVVDGSSPIQTEMQNKLAGGPRLASSVWLICRKRPADRPGLGQPGAFQDAREHHLPAARFPARRNSRRDFVWAATGPALEAFCRHPVVRRAHDPGGFLTVSDFPHEVCRIVVDFIGRVLITDRDGDAASGFDDVPTYYLLHRGDFVLGEAPAGSCILHALSCTLSDRDLSDRFAILSRPGRTLLDELYDDDEAASDENGDAGTGSGGGKAKWLGHDGPGGRHVPLIDRRTG